MIEVVAPRLFVAIALDGAADALRPLAAGLDGVRWSPAERLHLTLRFAGDRTDDLCHRLTKALSEVRSSPTDVTLQGVGRFDIGGGWGVVWAGIAPSPTLRDLQAQCEMAARQAGLPDEQRAWVPHVTVGYTASPEATQLASWLRRHQAFCGGPIPVSTFGLYESVRTGDELQYRLVQSYRLAN